MSDHGTGPTDLGFRLFGWLLTVASLFAWLRFSGLIGENSGDAGWLTAAVLATVWAAACAVLSAIKSLEHRLLQSDDPATD